MLMCRRYIKSSNEVLTMFLVEFLDKNNTVVKSIFVDELGLVGLSTYPIMPELRILFEEENGYVIRVTKIQKGDSHD